jgi:hypothetical protein
MASALTEVFAVHNLVTSIGMKARSSLAMIELGGAPTIKSHPRSRSLSIVTKHGLVKCSVDAFIDTFGWTFMHNALACGNAIGAC